MEATERQEGERATRQRRRAPVRVLRRGPITPELVDASDPLPHVARVGIEVARVPERGERGIEVAAPELQLAARGERVLLADRGRVVVTVEHTGRVERLGRAVEVPEVAVSAREVEEHLHLHAAPALALLARRLVPDRACAGQRIDGLARPVELLEAVAASEEAEMIGGKGGERAIVPAERLRPFLLALEVPADGAVEHRGTTRRELGAAEKVALDLLLVPEHAERAADLVQQLRGVPGLPLRGVVDRAVARDDGLHVATVRERADLGEYLVDVDHAAPPSTCRTV